MMRSRAKKFIWEWEGCLNTPSCKTLSNASRLGEKTGGTAKKSWFRLKKRSCKKKGTGQRKKPWRSRHKSSQEVSSAEEQQKTRKKKVFHEGPGFSSREGKPFVTPESMRKRLLFKKKTVLPIGEEAISAKRKENLR